MSDKNEEPALTQADYEALANLRHTLRRFLAFSTSAAQAVGLPPQQHQALLALRGNPGGQTMTVGELAERLLIAPHTATELVGRLAEADLISKTPAPQDRRCLMLSLTLKAEYVLCSLSRIHLNEIKEIAPVLIEILRTLDGRN